MNEFSPLSTVQSEKEFFSQMYFAKALEDQFLHHIYKNDAGVMKILFASLPKEIQNKLEQEAQKPIIKDTPAVSDFSKMSFEHQFSPTFAESTSHPSESEITDSFLHLPLTKQVALIFKYTPSDLRFSLLKPSLKQEVVLLSTMLQNTLERLQVSNEQFGALTPEEKHAFLKETVYPEWKNLLEQEMSQKTRLYPTLKNRSVSELHNLNEAITNDLLLSMAGRLGKEAIQEVNNIQTMSAYGTFGMISFPKEILEKMTLPTGASDLSALRFESSISFQNTAVNRISQKISTAAEVKIPDTKITPPPPPAPPSQPEETPEEKQKKHLQSLYEEQLKQQQETEMRNQTNIQKESPSKKASKVSTFVENSAVFGPVGATLMAGGGTGAGIITYYYGYVNNLWS